MEERSVNPSIVAFVLVKGWLNKLSVNLSYIRRYLLLSGSFFINLALVNHSSFLIQVALGMPVTSEIEVALISE